MKTGQEHKFTSTGVKFWKHPDQMCSYREDTGHTIISTHISPEGSCNLNCKFCSVKKRKRHFRIELDVIKDYIDKLCSRGLKAVIVTGGGEPTLYPQFNHLIQWLCEKGLSVALITNGWECVDRVETWNLFSWIRVSINLFPGWQNKIYVPKEKLDRICVLGCSFIYTDQSIRDFCLVASFARMLGAEYVRVLPDCLLNQEELLLKHEEIKYILGEVSDPIFFHQFKVHGMPKARTCHQAYFRPYLSEVDGGTVYPCDSVVLNNRVEHFDKLYQICKAEQVLDFLDGKIKIDFDVQKHCMGCVFADNINMLELWKRYYTKSNTYDGDLSHAEFV